jgi:hypothetical protein
MSFGDIVYIVAVILFVYMTFGIIRNYYKSKFDDEGHRVDMIDNEENKK